MSTQDELEQDAKQELIAEQNRLLGLEQCEICYEWRELYPVMDGRAYRICKKCIEENYCPCGKPLETSQERTARNCQSCLTDIG